MAALTTAHAPACDRQRTSRKAAMPPRPGNPVPLAPELQAFINEALDHTGSRTTYSTRDPDTPGLKVALPPAKA
ncbi:MAG: hypothetical protein ABW178_03625 [Pseudoxanthomonas sp.]